MKRFFAIPASIAASLKNGIFVNWPEVLVGRLQRF
jgi:hypothetical protein